jgi:predicted Rossmann fold nucleotide-binding protein DprA/Smf involved in DNA uptake
VTAGAGRLLALLADAPRGQDELVRATGLAASAVAAALVELELAGLAVEAEGVYRPARVPERAA